MKGLQSALVTFALVVAFLFGGFTRDASAVNPWGPMKAIESEAKKEGKVVLYVASGHTSAEAQRSMSQAFKERYGVDIEWTATGGSREIAPRILAEQRTKQYVGDIAMSGPGSLYQTLKTKGYLEQILAPSTMEEGVWRLDPANAIFHNREWLFINMPLRPSFFINTNLIPAGEEPKNYRDLLDTKWKGKIVMQSPAVGGSGGGWFTATYRKLGLDYMKALAKQVVLVAKVNDVPQAVVLGKYPVGLAASPTRSRNLINQGAPVRFIQPEEGSHLAAQGIYFIRNAPHPNAAKLFFNWFYTKEGQTIYARDSQVISVRKDVAQDYLPPDERYVDGQPFMIASVDDYTVEGFRKILALRKGIFEGGK